MQEYAWHQVAKNYIKDLASYYGLELSEIKNENCEGFKIKGKASEYVLSISGDCKEKQNNYVLYWGIPKYFKKDNATYIDISYLEEFLRNIGNVDPLKGFYEKNYKDYLRPSNGLDFFRSLTEPVMGNFQNQFENTIVKFYSLGRTLVKKSSLGSETTFVREKFVKVAEDLDLIQLVNIVPSNDEYFYLYSLTPVGLGIAQKLAEETFTAKQSVVGMWLDRHDPATAYLAAFSVSYASPFYGYPNCCLLSREAVTKLQHVPCFVKGKSACEKLLLSQIQPKLALFADTLLFGDSFSETIYNVLYELTASYLAYIGRTEISGKDTEVFCIVPDLTKAILDATREEFVKKFQNDETVEDLSSLAASVMVIKEGYSEEMKGLVSDVFGIDLAKLQKNVEEMKSLGLITEDYKPKELSKIKEYVKAKVEEYYVNLGLY